MTRSLTPYAIGWNSPWSEKLTVEEKRELTSAIIQILIESNKRPLCGLCGTNLLNNPHGDGVCCAPGQGAKQ